MASGLRLVHLVSVAKAFPGFGGAMKVVFRPTSISLPTDRRLAILGDKRAGKTTLLRLLARKLAPDEGRLVALQQFSPVVNGGGLFHPQLTVLENIQFIARIFRVDADRLTLSVAAFSENNVSLEVQFKTTDVAERRAFEAATMIILPFDCYLVDDAGQLPPGLLERSFEAAKLRNAGLIFSTANARLARQHADAVLVIGDRTLHPFADIEEGIEFFDRQSG